MPVRLNGSTSGYTELSAPAVAGDNNIALPTGNGSAFQILRNGATAGTTEFTDKIVSGTAVASTSGTSIDFTGIPSWAKRVTVMFAGVSTSGTSGQQIQLGTSGGVVTTGYTSGAFHSANASTFATSTTGFILSVGNNSLAVDTKHGAIVISNIGSNNWVEQGVLHSAGYNVGNSCAGSVTLSGTLDRVRITTVNGTDTFDAGSINILYE